MKSIFRWISVSLVLFFSAYGIANQPCNEVGNLIKKESPTETRRYKWTQGGMLSTVIRPDRKKVEFTYDALGRRLTKTFENQTTHFVWDGNVPLHEWTTASDESNFGVSRPLSGVEMGELSHKSPENLTTWIFEDGTFIPPDGYQEAKLQGDKAYSIITDHLGTPTEAYDNNGDKVWSRQLNIYGETRRESGEKNFIPFLYQGQYFDEETELAYNRFRYYDSSAGVYISEDPIRLASNNPTFYAYTHDVNSWIDPLGLNSKCSVNLDSGTVRAMMDGGSEMIENALINKKLFITETALSEVSEFAEKYGRKADLDNLINSRNISKIADDPSERALNLATTRKVGEADKIIFGTGDKLGMPTITSDAKFLRGASSQGVNFDAIVHPPL